MKGRMLSKTKMKTWWMIAAVFALALSLTSCSRRPSSLNTYGLNFCDGTMGEIDVYTIAVNGSPGTYKVVIIPASLNAPGDIVTITIINSQTKLYKTLLGEVALDVDRQITAGYITENELQTYDQIAITTYTPGVDFLNSFPAKDAICELPIVGQGTNLSGTQY